MTDPSAATSPTPMPADPFPEPARPPAPPEQTPADPVNVPPPGPDVIYPGGGEPLGVPPTPDIQPSPEPPNVA
jgi:hypothetical protein